MPKLENLKLTAPFTVKIISLPEKLPSLKELNVSNCSYLEVFKLPSDLNSCTVVYFDSVGIAALDFSTMSAIRDFSIHFCDNLQKLILPANAPNIKYIGITHCPSLTQLSLPNNPPKDTAISISSNQNLDLSTVAGLDKYRRFL